MPQHIRFANDDDDDDDCNEVEVQSSSSPSPSSCQRRPQLRCSTCLRTDGDGIEEDDRGGDGDGRIKGRGPCRFSKRQRKRADRGEPARCASCVAANEEEEKTPAAACPAKEEDDVKEAKGEEVKETEEKVDVGAVRADEDDDNDAVETEKASSAQEKEAAEEKKGDDIESAAKASSNYLYLLGDDEDKSDDDGGGDGDGSDADFDAGGGAWSPSPSDVEEKDHKTNDQGAATFAAANGNRRNGTPKSTTTSRGTRNVGRSRATPKYGDFDDTPHGGSSKGTPGSADDVNLRDLKRRILRRDLLVSPRDGRYEDEENDDDAYPEAERALRRLTGATPIHDNDDNDAAAAVAAGDLSTLRRELTCPVCHELLYRPVGLTCGHTFCRPCLDWWLSHSASTSDRRHRDRWHRGDIGNVGHDDDDDDDDEGGGNNRKTEHGTCPTCRHPLPVDGSECGVNTSLRSALSLLFPSDVQRRLYAEEIERRRRTKGENGGAHDRGNEVVRPLKDEEWTELAMDDALAEEEEEEGGGRGSSGAWSVRRSVVLDDDDQRMQFALALRSFPTLTTSSAAAEESPSSSSSSLAAVVVEVRLCLLTLEEDEANDGRGFPFIVPDAAAGGGDGGCDEGAIDDDEHLVVRDGRFDACAVEACAIVVRPDGVDGCGEGQDDEEEERPLGRRAAGKGDDAVVRFDVDVKELSWSESGITRCVDAGAPTTVLRFRHGGTGAELELRPPKGDGRLQLGKKGRSGADERAAFGHRAPRRRVVRPRDDSDNDNDAHLDEFEDDGFVVMDGEDEEEGDEDEGDLCHVCRDGGELLVCDGGDDRPGVGCGRSFHVGCISRDRVPDGDWICRSCAEEFFGEEVNMGIGGHEFPSGEDMVGSGDGSDVLADTEPSRKVRLKRKGGEVLEDDDTSDEDEFQAQLEKVEKSEASGDESDASLEVLEPQRGAAPKRRRVLDSDED